MGKKYSRMMATGRGISVDPQWAFEVAAGKIVTYKKEHLKGFWNSLAGKFNWTATSKEQISSNSTVTISAPSDGGSGYCDFKNPDTGFSYSYHIHGEAQEFAAEVQREIDNAPS